MTNYDWLSDLQPLFAAQESWLKGTYNKPITAQLVCQTDAPFSIACGAGLLAEHIRRFKFEPKIIQRLGQVTDAKGRSVFQESFLNHLQRLRLRTHVNAAPEGTLLLPGEPVLTIQSPELQALLLESAIRLLIWESTCWTTKAALEQWQNGVFSEEETPHPPNFPFNPTGWKMRAQYIGGGASEGSNLSEAWAGLTKIEHGPGQSLSQIRRLFKGEHPLGDVWLTAVQEAHASVSHTHIQFADDKTGKLVEVQMSRFQNLMQPVLVKGHPALISPSLDYLRQRTWKQLEAFHELDLASYQR
ncbi:MAG: hypothetical protein Q7T20_09390, partial [Saprospiraceae bacterium]|nr:hypothetical protein [Saprospiraceae bacterium]